MHVLTKLVAGLAALALTAPAHAQSPSPDQVAAIKAAKALLDDLHPVTGDVRIPEADAVLHLGEDYYFLPASEAQRVLVEGWDNPPDSVGNVLGMVFPAGKTFMDDSWGAVITFDPVGYVSDEDAQSTDYDALLVQMRSGEEELNARRIQAGYPGQHLVGWAQPPAYDARTHSVVWAQNVRFDGQADNTLNYDVRLLGRRGVLSLNLVTGMSKLEEAKAAAGKFAASASFNPGARYADYQPGTDKKADYGVAGLVAAGVGVAAAKKLGVLAVILAFGKKFLFLIIAGVAAIGAGVRRFARRRQEEEEAAAYASDETAATEGDPIFERPAAAAPRSDGT